jgi:hypothetical protein
MSMFSDYSIADIFYLDVFIIRNYILESNAMQQGHLQIVLR